MRERLAVGLMRFGAWVYRVGCRVDPDTLPARGPGAVTPETREPAA